MAFLYKCHLPGSQLPGLPKAGSTKYLFFIKLEVGIGREYWEMPLLFCWLKSFYLTFLSSLSSPYRKNLRPFFTTSLIKSGYVPQIHPSHFYGKLSLKCTNTPPKKKRNECHPFVFSHFAHRKTSSASVDSSRLLSSPSDLVPSFDTSHTSGSIGNLFPATCSVGHSEPLLLDQYQTLLIPSSESRNILGTND